MKLFYNDHDDKTSYEVDPNSIPSLVGIADWEYVHNYASNYKKLNEDIKSDGIEISDSPIYKC